MVKSIFIIILILLFIPSCAMLFKTHYMDRLNFGEFKDGIYTGDDSVLLCSVKLNVEIKDNKIKDIKILNKFFTWPIAMGAYEEIPERIIKEQSLDVDAITMATLSSNNVKKAVLNALEKAKR